ncbi:RlmE family RNA methyltransferase [Aestuariispira ectoiniformans]|uniref:RlmE family RNA methyltransferase n=1 Tax=Aestuariispira ectoiniformans TaxID=2775080 RepID=UPI00223B3CA4|nr:RlmE family RNA methyltransferase [Aestuariispira ectoiniformans]
MASGVKGGGGKKGKGKKGASVRNVTDGRQPRVRVKTAKRRKTSSTRWLERQLNDPYVAEARRLGYRGRAAFKLIEIDDKYDFLQPGQTVLDLGCAPGGWVQVTQERIGEKGAVVGIDLLEVEPIAGATLIQKDFMDDDAPDLLKSALGGPVDVVLSDMAPWTTGHAPTDHLRIIGLVEAAAYFAAEVLKPGGSFIAKVFSGGTEQNLLNQLKRDYQKVAHFKPPASRKESAEMYVVAIGFRGERP